MVILVYILLLLLCGAGYVIYNLNKKYTELEEIALENQEFIFSLRNRVQSHRSALKQLDKIGSFEADDETGYFFKEMKDIINDIAIYFGQTPIDDNRESILEKQKFDAKFEKDYYL